MCLSSREICGGNEHLITYRLTEVSIQFLNNYMHLYFTHCCISLPRLKASSGYNIVSLRQNRWKKNIYLNDSKIQIFCLEISRIIFSCSYTHFIFHHAGLSINLQSKLKIKIIYQSPWQLLNLGIRNIGFDFFWHRNKSVYAKKSALVDPPPPSVHRNASSSSSFRVIWSASLFL